MLYLLITVNKKHTCNVEFINVISEVIISKVIISKVFISKVNISKVFKSIVVVSRLGPTQMELLKGLN
jgi:hypothetical protein